MDIRKWLHKELNFSSTWMTVLAVGTGIGLLLSGSMILLQPFDTYNFNSPYKNLLLLGYTPAILLGTVLVYPLEKWLYEHQQDQWRIWNEILIIMLGGMIMMTSSYLHNTLVVNRFTPSFTNWWDFIRSFGFPFFVFLSPAWHFLRKLISKKQKNTREKPPLPLIITSQNKGEKMELLPEQFIFAQAQHNYMEIFYRTQEGAIKKEMLRITLSQLQQQIPDSHQTHRSYLVNPQYVQAFVGNARKRTLQLEGYTEPIPVSTKYYEALKNQLSNSAQ